MRPSGLFPSDRNNPVGSLVTGIPAAAKLRAIKSLRAWCLADLLLLLLATADNILFVSLWCLQCPLVNNAKVSVNQSTRLKMDATFPRHIVVTTDENTTLCD